MTNKKAREGMKKLRATKAKKKQQNSDKYGIKLTMIKCVKSQLKEFKKQQENI